MGQLQTTHRHYVTPDVAEPPNGPAQFKTLADAVDVDVQALFDMVNDWQQRTPRAEAAGSLSIQLSSTNATTMRGVALPPGRFNVAPVVFVNIAIASGATGRIMARAFNISTSAFDIALLTGDAGVMPGPSYSALVQWHAVQMTATSAAG